jgi:N-dimethylarginine dimethylaminohydrolase
MKQKILMCAPDFFAVDYVINPWMRDHLGAITPSLARSQWQALHDKISGLADIVLQPPVDGLPDLVFTANAGLVYRDSVIVSRFLNPERQGETKHDTACFSGLGYQFLDWPDAVAFEGAGDALFDRAQDILWLGAGFRSDPRAAQLLQKLLPVEVMRLELIDPRFYHLDTCWCPLASGVTLYYPAAFSSASQAVIASRIPPEKLIAVSEQDALNFACNAVTIDQHIILNRASASLCERLAVHGFSVQQTPLDEFMKAGGAAKCLSLKLLEP